MISPITRSSQYVSRDIRILVAVQSSWVQQPANKTKLSETSAEIELLTRTMQSPVTMTTIASRVKDIF